MFKNLQMQNKELQAETKDDSEQLPIVIPSSPNAAKPNVICSNCGYCCCNEKQIEISKGQSPSDYGSSANVIFVRNGKYFIDNPNYKSKRSLFLDICIFIMLSAVVVALRFFGCI